MPNWDEEERYLRRNLDRVCANALQTYFMYRFAVGDTGQEFCYLLAHPSCAFICVVWALVDSKKPISEAKLHVYMQTEKGDLVLPPGVYSAVKTTSNVHISIVDSFAESNKLTGDQLQDGVELALAVLGKNKIAPKFTYIDLTPIIPRDISWLAGKWGERRTKEYYIGCAQRLIKHLLAGHAKEVFGERYATVNVP